MRNVKLHTYYEDEVIMREGESYHEMFKIIYGSVAVYAHYGEKDEHLMRIYSRSNCFGEMNVFSDQPSIYTAVAFDEVLLLRITQDSLEEFIRNNPRSAIDIMQSMAHTHTLLQKNIGLLLEGVYDKEDENQQRTGELKRLITQCSAGGFHIPRQGVPEHSFVLYPRGER